MSVEGIGAARRRRIERYLADLPEDAFKRRSTRGIADATALTTAAAGRVLIRMHYKGAVWFTYQKIDGRTHRVWRLS